MAVKKLTDAEVAEHAQNLTGWSLVDNVISKTFTFKDFTQSLEFVIQLAETAEEVHHHPDIDIRYNKVKIALSTHDVKGLSGLDFQLAGVAEDLAGAFDISAP